MFSRHIFVVFASTFATYALAAPQDLFLTAQDLKPTSHPLLLNMAVDAVDDNIDIFDMREAEGITDKSAGDYFGIHINAQYQVSPNWVVEGSLWNREIDYSKDTNEIQSYLLAVQYLPNLSLNKNDSIKLRVSLWGNQGELLSKTTPTVVNKYQFQEVNVHNPEDLQLQLDTIFSRKLDHMNQINGFVSLGYSKVEVGGIDVKAPYDGCLMNIAIQKNNSFKGKLAEPCSKGNITFTKLNVSGDAREFGLDIQKDLNYDSYYASLGGSWNWRYRQFESQLAYQYQRLWRKDIDDRISNFGNSPIKDNHTFGAKFSYDFTPKLTGYLQGQLFQNNLVGYVPFLYNGVTASRLDKRYGLASIGIQYHGF